MGYYEKMMDKNIGYHYCGVEAFFEIIKNKKIWLSDASYSNDKKEIKWIDDLVDNLLKELVTKESLSTNDTSIFKKNYESFKDKKSYIFCLSKKKDLLSQWRGYANNGKGVAIGFRMNLAIPILKIPPINNSVSKDPRGNLKSNVFKIGYGDTIYEKNLNVKEYENKIKQYPNDIDMCALMVKEIASFFKHPSFEEEQEVRIVYSPANNPQMQQNKHLDDALKKISEKKYRYSNGQIIPYFEFDFKDNCNLLISEIILGPKCILKKDDLKEFLKSNGFEITKIINSGSPYI